MNLKFINNLIIHHESSTSFHYIKDKNLIKNILKGTLKVVLISRIMFLKFSQFSTPKSQRGYLLIR